MGKSDPFPLSPLKGMEPFFGQRAKELFPAKPECFHLAFLGNKRGNHGQGRGLGVEALGSLLHPRLTSEGYCRLPSSLHSPRNRALALSIRVKPALLPRWWAGVGRPSRRSSNLLCSCDGGLEWGSHRGDCVVSMPPYVC